jgi:hypothetical protein
MTSHPINAEHILAAKQDEATYLTEVFLMSTPLYLALKRVSKPDKANEVNHLKSAPSHTEPSFGSKNNHN